MAKLKQIILVFLRLAIGWLFLWGFLDKTWGLGFPTDSAKAWLVGNSPTYGFLKFATYGPLAPYFQNLAGQAWVDWLFMIGLLLIGLALILGIGIRVAGVSGALMMLFMYLSLFPPQDNPAINQHIIYIIILLYLPLTRANYYYGMGQWWENRSLVKKYRWLV